MLLAYQPHGRRAHSKETVSSAIEMYANGKSIKEISTITGAGYSQVCWWISEFYFGYKGENKITITLKSKI